MVIKWSEHEESQLDQHAYDGPARYTEKSRGQAQRTTSGFDELSRFDHLPWYKRPSIYWLLVPFAFSALAHGGTIVPHVNLVLSLICHNYLKANAGPDSIAGESVFSFEPGEQCRVAGVQTQTATFKLLISAITGLLAAVAAPTLGALSDKYGRTKMLAIVNCGMIVNEIMTVLAATFPNTVHVNWILVGAAFDGLTGSFIASMAISQSYVSDVTPASERQIIFGWFHGCLFTGIAVGPMLAGYIIHLTGSVIFMFYLATCCHIGFLLLLLFLIPESVPEHRQMAAREKDETHSGSQSLMQKISQFKLLEPLKILHGPAASPSIRRNLILLATLDTIVFGVGMGALHVVLLYSNYIFGWDQWHQAKFTTVINTSRVLCLLVLLPSATSFLRKRRARLHGTDHRPASPRSADIPEGTDAVELSIIRLALCADTLGFLGYATTTTAFTFTLSGTIASIGGMGSPSMQAALTKHVSKGQVGELLGAMGLLHALARVVGPTVFTGIYARTVAVFPQAYFWVLAGGFGFAFLLSWRIRPSDSTFRNPRLD